MPRPGDYASAFNFVGKAWSEVWGTKCLPWPVARGNLLRNGQGPLYK